MKVGVKALLLGIPFLVLYFIIRSLPVEPCDFLHEETYNAEGELDYCGADETGFVDLSVRKWPMKVEFRPLDPLQVGQECKFEVKIEQADGSPLCSKDVALSHTQKIHLLAVNESLNDYHHIHPTADSLFDGVWHFSLTPELSGKYSVFFDFIPLKSPRRVLLSSSFSVTGETPSPMSVDESLSYKFQNLEFELVKVANDSDPKEFNLTLRGLNENGDSAVFHPVMGAFAHMVAFDKTANGFAHLHPLGDERPLLESETFTGDLTFGFTAPSIGTYRLWAQVKTSPEDEILIPFDLTVGS